MLSPFERLYMYMKKNIKTKTARKTGTPDRAVGADFFERLWDESWTYIKTVVDVVREPILILNKDLCVMAANEPFYRMFQVKPKDTEHTLVYEIGNGQWNIPALRKLLENIIPEHTFFKGFEVVHKFPIIGQRVMILNARRIYRQGNGAASLPPIIVLAMEDVTEMMNVAEMLSRRTNEFEAAMAERTQKMEVHIKKLQKQLGKIKKM
jgi:hypothetical protein